VPERGLEIALILTHDRHAHVRDEVIGPGGEHTLENVGGITMATALEKGFAHQAIRLDILRKMMKDVLAVRQRLFEVLLVDQLVDLPVVGA